MASTVAGRVGCPWLEGPRYVAGVAGIDAVIFDWGGTLTQWHDIDFHAEALALAQAVRQPDPGHAGDPDGTAHRLREAAEKIWRRARDRHRSATLEDVFRTAGLELDPDLLTAYYDFWEPHTLTDPEVGPLWQTLREQGLKVGVLSNTLWPRAWHRGFFARDGVLELLDADVYTSEIAYTKPAPEAFDAARRALGAPDPTRCVYVGDRLFDDIHGADQAGMHTIHVPHSNIPAEQVGHTQGVPDAVAHRLADVAGIVGEWTRQTVA